MFTNVLAVLGLVPLKIHKKKVNKKPIGRQCLVAARPTVDMKNLLQYCAVDTSRLFSTVLVAEASKPWQSRYFDLAESWFQRQVWLDPQDGKLSI
jgi:hypothetical protein